LAVGLGRLVVEGGLALRFSPKHPLVMPQFATRRSLLNSSQQGFWAIDMNRSCCTTGDDLLSTVQYYDLRTAEEDGSLRLAGSVYCVDDEILRDDLKFTGPRVVTFNNVLKHEVVPLAEAVGEVLTAGRRGLGCAVEVEFACDMGGWGRPGGSNREPVLFLLQIRPLASRSNSTGLSRIEFSREETLCSSRGSLGHGENSQIRDIVYVREESWEARYNRIIAGEVDAFNTQLENEDRPYLLIGPGRWGTADEWLGIPVRWAQVSKAKIIVEASPEGYDVEPSQGTHFFHNIAAHDVGYLTLPPGVDKSNPASELYMDWRWLDSQAAVTETTYLRHLQFDAPLTVMLDGRRGRGIIAKPGARGT